MHVYTPVARFSALIFENVIADKVSRNEDKEGGGGGWGLAWIVVPEKHSATLFAPRRYHSTVLQHGLSHRSTTRNIISDIILSRRLSSCPCNRSQPLFRHYNSLPARPLFTLLRSSLVPPRHGLPSATAASRRPPPYPRFINFICTFYERHPQPETN